MAQNIYDDPTFFAGYSQLERSVHGLAGAPEWPTIQAMLPDVRGMAVADLGCGFGWFCRWARAQGAASVLGVDLSHNMLARAQAETNDPAITYQQADLEALELPEASFDLVYSSLAMHYIVDVARLFGSIQRALVPGGRFVFTTEHPIYMAPRNPNWVRDAQGSAAWPLNQYGAEGPRVTNWLAEGVVKQHRTLATTINRLIESGLAIAHVEEWMPTREIIAAAGAPPEECERPLFLLVATQKR
ncbi:class I SAM-dependent methyltransferase [Chloroflexia bacterium SDU3-3]|nr:class I SAM-dependent methyltransferase [Chloroflexia bacterium SDU3-3]